MREARAGGRIAAPLIFFLPRRSPELAPAGFAPRCAHPVAVGSSGRSLAHSGCGRATLGPDDQRAGLTVAPKGTGVNPRRLAFTIRDPHRHSAIPVLYNPLVLIARSGAPSAPIERSRAMISLLALSILCLAARRSAGRPLDGGPPHRFPRPLQLERSGHDLPRAGRQPGSSKLVGARARVRGAGARSGARAGARPLRTDARSVRASRDGGRRARPARPLRGPAAAAARPRGARTVAAAAAGAASETRRPGTIPVTVWSEPDAASAPVLSPQGPLQ